MEHAEKGLQPPLRRPNSCERHSICQTQRSGTDSHSGFEIIVCSESNAFEAAQDVTTRPARMNNGFSKRRHAVQPM
jgi:hypothetical protein